MSDANAVSDLERAEHLNYADGKGVKRVSVFNDGVQVNVSTEAKQDSIIEAIQDVSSLYPAGTGTNGSVTLTNANTAYSIPATAPTGNYVIILYNGSDTDMFVGFENSNANGIILPSGGNMSLNLGANQLMYAYCATAGKVLTYSLKLI